METTYEPTYEQGKPYYHGHSWFRNDLFIPTGQVERWFVAGPDDDSPAYRHWENGKYNPSCACCWLGFGHSENCHKKNIMED